jgi:cyclophilin family peptidyl-prolyl cis-trans isomerase
MSQASSLSEPLTHGKVVMSTTYASNSHFSIPFLLTVCRAVTSRLRSCFFLRIGDFDIELWSKEAPLACRHFMQLCLDGYYNKLSFFRVCKNFIAQSGDATNTGDGGANLYDDPDRAPVAPAPPGFDASTAGPWASSSSGKTVFKTETHSRLHFNRAGLLALTGNGVAQTAEAARLVVGVKQKNTSQFFITLAPTPWLDGKHTLFASITGDTRYNVNTLNDLECDEDQRPTRPPVITRVTVVANPFPDLKPSAAAVAAAQAEAGAAAAAAAVSASRGKAAAGAKTGKNDLTLLSFGGDDGFGDGDEDGGDDFAPARLAAVSKKLKKPASGSGGSIFDVRDGIAGADREPHGDREQIRGGREPMSDRGRDSRPTPAPAPAPAPSRVAAPSDTTSSNGSSSQGGDAPATKVSAVAAMRSKYLSRKALARSQAAPDAAAAALGVRDRAWERAREEREDRTAAMLQKFLAAPPAWAQEGSGKQRGDSDDDNDGYNAGGDRDREFGDRDREDRERSDRGDRDREDRERDYERSRSSSDRH